ncbi:hypothetical protein LRD18_10925 [Halorhodospira halochloris]|uniref:hypothetical protein n=1 Tax=Halorhodospira halochloris TaxID=1052 RepID=UPI001EE9165D|nr:hypothetical protein [Halorhodospira halochloris]MCG5531360.1 hypothetical protein [Halorhodospira halochloris]MCG5549321.1 hypothetical protein [Halorhodospira halochloris]
MKRLFTALSAVVLAAGCMPMPDKPGTVYSSTAPYDGRTEVRMKPAGLDANPNTVPVTLGAIWQEDRPEEVLIKVGIRTTAYGFGPLHISVDGEETILSSEGLANYDVEAISSYILTKSSAYYPADIDLIESIVDARDARLRLVTQSGSFDGVFQDAKYGALNGLHDFLGEVNQHR